MERRALASKSTWLRVAKCFSRLTCRADFQIREQIPEAHLVFIEPPSLEVLESRLRGRGTDSEESIAVRMKNAQVELSHKMEYDKQFVNDDLEACTDELVAYIESQAKMCEE